MFIYQQLSNDSSSRLFRRFSISYQPHLWKRFWL